MIYLYGLTGPLRIELDGTGLDGAALEAVTMDRLTVIYSEHEALELRAGPDSCWAHERAVESVMRSQTILPARFGTTFADVDDLLVAVADNAPALERCLSEVEGCVELAVRIGPLVPEDREPGGGRDYLVGKLSVQRRREALAEGTLACLKELAVASKLAAQPTRGEAVSISYLVRVTEVERFARAVRRLADRWPEFALSCTGPWAPYSFVAVPACASAPSCATGSASRVPAEVL